jgi:aminoglycoside phosphotransferase (APT) family kinase protein
MDHANTETVADPPGLRLRPLLHHIADQVDIDPNGRVSVTLLAQGRSNLSYLLHQEDRSWVLRRPPLGHVMPTAHDMGREYKALEGLSQVGFQVPRPFLLCLDDSVIGAPFLVMEYVDGRVIGDAEDAASLGATEASDLSRHLVETLAGLHAVDAAAAGLEGFGRPDGYLVRQVRRWAQQWERTKTRDLDTVPHLVAALDRKVAGLPTNLPWSVVHGDFRLDNVILDHHDNGVRAVVDWEMSTLGDPVADLAVMLVYWSRPGETLRHRVPVAPGVTDGPGFWERPSLIEHYAALSGRDVSHLDICIGLACLKLAVIMESIHYRTLHGHQRGSATATGVNMEAATDALAQLGEAVVSGDGLSALSR